MSVYQQAINNIAANVPKEAAGDYIGEDGLLYCGKCHTPKQYRVPIMGVVRAMPIACECHKAKVAEDEKQARLYRIDRLRRECFDRKKEADTPKEWGYTFAVDKRPCAQASDAAQRFVDNWSEMWKTGTGLLLYGPVGTGKSFLAASIANALIDQCIPVRMTNFATINRELMGMWEGKQAYIDRLMSFPLLIIDDLGTERETPAMFELVYDIINARASTGRPLIVTTNVSFEEIKEPQEIKYKRIYDRVLENCHPIKVDGPSQRRENVKAKYIGRKKLLGM